MSFLFTWFLLGWIIDSGKSQTPCGLETASDNVQMDKEQLYFVDGHLYYDAVNRRIREFEMKDIADVRQAFVKLKLYKENVQYTVDLYSRTCNVTSPIPEEWTPLGVPHGAIYRGEGTLGAVGIPTESVDLQFFQGVESRGPYMVAVTYPDCFLVEFAVWSNSESSGFFHELYYDVVSGISDPEAFDVPRECVRP